MRRLWRISILFLILGGAVRAGAVPTLIKQAPDNVSGPVTFASATTAGNTIICTYYQSGGPTTPVAVVSDASNGTYSTAAYNNTGVNGTVGIAYRLSANSTTSVSIAPGSGGMIGEFTCFEYSGVSGFDSGSPTFTEVTSYTANVGTLNTSTLGSTGELIITKCVTNLQSSVAASGYTEIDGTGGDGSYSTIASTSSFTGQIGTASAPNTIDIVLAGFTATGVSTGHGFSSVSTTDISITGTNTTATSLNLNVTGTNGGITLGPNGSGIVTLGGTSPSITSLGSLSLQSGAGSALTLGNNAAASTAIVRSGTGKIFLTGGNVGVGTATPGTQLDVNGGLRIGDDATACSTTNAGEIKYSSNLMYYCNGSAWTAF